MFEAKHLQRKDFLDVSFTLPAPRSQIAAPSVLIEVHMWAKILTTLLEQFRLQNLNSCSTNEDLGNHCRHPSQPPWDNLETKYKSLVDFWLHILGRNQWKYIQEALECILASSLVILESCHGISRASDARENSFHEGVNSFTVKGSANEKATSSSTWGLISH